VLYGFIRMAPPQPKVSLPNDLVLKSQTPEVVQKRSIRGRRAISSRPNFHDRTAPSGSNSLQSIPHLLLHEPPHTSTPRYLHIRQHVRGLFGRIGTGRSRIVVTKLLDDDGPVRFVPSAVYEPRGVAALGYQDTDR
jgi:hypothetical protein